ncbi:MAG: hypothetical protein RLZZ531_1280 [Bacteroidota bacterium]|jgi:hypothetical protein
MKQIITLTFLSFFGLTHAQIPSYVPSNGLVGWWPFNGNANDESGNGNNGTVNGATLTTDRFGNVNVAYQFNGVSEYIEVPHSQSLAITGDLTISLWKKSQGNLGNYETFVNKRSSQSNWNFSFGASYYYGVGGCPQEVNKYFTSRRNDSGLQYQLKFTDYLVSNDSSNWTHLVVTINQNSVKFYVNGVQTDYSCFGNQFSIPSVDVGAPLTIGASLPNFNEFFHGTLDDIGIWNRALTDCEVQDLYQAQLGFTTLNAGADQEVCHGTEVTLNGTGGSNLTWNNGVVNGVSFVPTQTSNYILTGADSLGCVGVDTVMVMVNAPTTSSQTQVALDTYTWPVNNQTYTQSGMYTDTLVNAAGCDSILTLNLSMEYTGLFDGEHSHAFISPNPVKDQFVLHDAANLTALNLLDVQGKLVQTLDVQQDEFSLSNLKPGIYFLELQQGNHISVFKVMKE